MLDHHILATTGPAGRKDQENASILERIGETDQLQKEQDKSSTVYGEQG